MDRRGETEWGTFDSASCTDPPARSAQNEGVALRRLLAIELAASYARAHTGCSAAVVIGRRQCKFHSARFKPRPDLIRLHSRPIDFENRPAATISRRQKGRADAGARRRDAARKNRAAPVQEFP